MEDTAIIELFWARDQRAIGETEAKYGLYLARIADNVLSDREDSAECVNDALLAAWNAIPPQRPAALRHFLGKLTRRIALNRLRSRLTQKRGGGEAAAAFEELAELVPDTSNTASEAEARELTRVLDRFLDGLGSRERAIFVRRYWAFDTVASIAAATGMSVVAVKTSLHRTREKLRATLEKEEWL